MTEIVEAQAAELAERDEQRAALARKGVNDTALMHAEMIYVFAPYAHNRDHPFTKDDALFTALRCREMGVHPLNQKGIQVYKDKHGVHIDYHYSMVAKWVSQFLKVRHTQPRYIRLGAEQLEYEGLSADSVAYYATFIPFDALDRYYETIDRMEEKAAYEMFAVKGIGSASKSQFNSSYFSPNGRSPAWKLQKRALRDAYTRWLGNPSPAEARFLQEQSDFIAPTLPELESAKHDVSDTIIPSEVIRLAQERKRYEESDAANSPPSTPEEIKDTKELLYGPQKTKTHVIVDAPPEVIDLTPPEFEDDAAGAQAVARLQEEAEAGGRGTPARGPLTAREIGTEMRKAAGWQIVGGQWERKGGTTIGNDKLGQQVAAIIGKALGDDSEALHSDIIDFLFKVESTKALTITEGMTIVERWGNGWQPNATAMTECPVIGNELK
ncbi:MAG: hypothetical protein GY832_44595 [Chloroflexi bacterium]|nr:hypothetical protein [Chloroflexota bacterium]